MVSVKSRISLFTFQVNALDRKGYSSVLSLHRGPPKGPASKIYVPPDPEIPVYYYIYQDSSNR